MIHDEVSSQKIYSNLWNWLLRNICTHDKNEYRTNFIIHSGKPKIESIK
jgi:hypothetical protein